MEDPPDVMRPALPVVWRQYRIFCFFNDTENQYALEEALN
jgi:hypothetical protein